MIIHHRGQLIMVFYSCQEYSEFDQLSLNGTHIIYLIVMCCDCSCCSFRDHYFSKGYVEVRCGQLHNDVIIT